MLAAMAVFVLNDTLMKLAAAHFPTGEAIFVRGVFTVGFCLALDLGQQPELGAAARGLPEGAAAQRGGYRRDRAVHDRADAYAARRHLRHAAVHAARHHGGCGPVPGRQGRLAAMAGDHRRPDRRADHRAAGRQRVQPLRHPGAGLDAVLRVARPRHPRRCPARAVADDRRSSATMVTLSSLGFTAVRDLAVAERLDDPDAGRARLSRCWPANTG